MGNSLFILGAIVIAALLIIINEHLLKRSVSKQKFNPNKKIPLGAIEYLDTTYIPITEFLKEKAKHKNVESGKHVNNETSRLKGTVLFILLLFVLLYFSSTVF